MKLLKILGVVISLLLIGVAAIKVMYGQGSAFPRVATNPRYPESQLETLVNLDFPPGNIAVSRGGRTFFNYHPFAKAQRFTSATVFELVDGRPVPYPNEAFQKNYQGVFGMTVDHQNRLWVVEPASLDHRSTRLLAFDLGTNAKVFEHAFEPGFAKFAQDLRVSPDGTKVIMADTGLFTFTPGSLIVFDVASREARSLLSGDPSTTAQDWFIKTRWGKHVLAFGLMTFKVGVDGISFSSDGSKLYYASMSHDSLYEISYADLLDRTLNEENLRQRIKKVGKKPQSDGIAVDGEGNVLITDVEGGGVAALNSDGGLETLVASPRVIWADGIALDAQGVIYFTDSAIPAYIDQLGRPPSIKTLESGRPYTIFSFRR